MSISGITNLNYYAMMQMANKQVQQQAQVAAIAAKTAAPAKISKQTQKADTGNDIAARLSRMPNLEQYEELIGRFISGESEPETMGRVKPLTEDQIALRQFMREYRNTDNRTIGQMTADMTQANKGFLEYWQANGNGAPAPARVIAPDGSFTIFNSKEERNEYMKNKQIDFLKEVMSVIQSRKNSGSEKNYCIDVKV